MQTITVRGYNWKAHVLRIDTRFTGDRNDTDLNFI